MTLAQPPWTKLGKHLESLVRKALYTYKMVDGAAKVAVALSGGKDSLAMLFLLHAIKGRGFDDFDLVAIHVSGEFSCGAGVSEKYIQQICDDLGVPLIIRESHIPLEKLACYSCSRERRKLLFQAAKEHDATTIAFGHHRDDNAQTLLMNLLHKGEFAGNLPKLEMVDFGITIVRPLIYVAERDLKEFAKAYGFARVVCGCPVGQHSMRKKADQLITELEEAFPNARANIASASLTYGSDKAKRV